MGVVSGLHRQFTAPNGFTLSTAVQTDAAINHGNSGGPLLDRNGRVIGVNAQIADSGVDANVGVGFAVAIDGSVRRAIDALEQGLRVIRSWLGVSLGEIDAILVTSGRVHATSGALITGVVSGGPAAKAGVTGGSRIATIDAATYCLGGDVVTAFAGTRTRTAGDLQNCARALHAGNGGQACADSGERRSRGPHRHPGVQPTTAPGTTTGCGG